MTSNIPPNHSWPSKINRSHPPLEIPGSPAQKNTADATQKAIAGILEKGQSSQAPRKKRKVKSISTVTHLIPDRKTIAKLEIAEMKSQLEKDPSNVHIAACLGEHYMKSKDFDQAFTYFSIALKSSPRDVGVLLHMSECYRSVGQPEAALVHLHAALEEDKDDTRVLKLLSKIYKDLGNNDKAVFYKKISNLILNARKIERNNSPAAPILSTFNTIMRQWCQLKNQQTRPDIL